MMHLGFPISWLRTLTDPWILRFTFITLIIFQLVRWLRCQYLVRQVYSQLPSFPMTPVIGSVLGHLENYWTGNPAKGLHITVFFNNITMGIARMMHQKGEGLFYLRLGPFRHFVYIINARAAEAILSSSKNLTKAPEYDFLKAYFGEGLITANVPRWKNHRKLVNPTFHFEILNKFIPVMNSQIDTFMGLINGASNNLGVSVLADIRPYLDGLSMDIFCQTAMGTAMNAQKDWDKLNSESPQYACAKTPESKFTEAVMAYLDIVCYRLVRPWLYSEALFKLFPIGRQLYRNVHTLHTFTNNVIAKRRTVIEGTLKASQSLEEATAKISEGSRLTFLDLLLVQHLKGGDNALDLISVQEEVQAFMIGGTETTSTTLQFALVLLGLHPDKQAKVHAELDHIFGDDMREITLEDTKKMAYLEMVIKETLRLYPTISFFGRSITEDFHVGKHLIPAGATVYIMPSAVHRDPEWYPQPEAFLPERFSPASPTPRHPYAFIPFSGGPRNCIGIRFAMLEMKLFLGKLLRQYTVRSLTKREDILVRFFVAAKSHNVIAIEFTKRRVTL